jgi:hypothetical protein
MPVAINTNINTPHVSRKLTVNMDQALINVRPIIKGNIS